LRIADVAQFWMSIPVEMTVKLYTVRDTKQER
jgi:hypothetical protein